MQACFFHTLTELDPQYSTHLAARPRAYRATMAERVLKQFGVTGEESEDLRLVSSSCGPGSGRTTRRPLVARHAVLWVCVRRT